MASSTVPSLYCSCWGIILFFCLWDFQFFFLSVNMLVFLLVDGCDICLDLCENEGQGGLRRGKGYCTKCYKECWVCGGKGYSCPWIQHT